MTAPTSATEVRDNAEDRQFEIRVDGELAAAGPHQPCAYAKCQAIHGYALE